MGEGRRDDRQPTQSLPPAAAEAYIAAMDTLPPDTDLIGRLRDLLGPAGVLTDPADTAPYCEDWRRLYRGRTPAVLRPATTAEVAVAVRVCAAHGVPIVPMGGNTSMVGGAAVSDDNSQIILSLMRSEEHT